MISVDLDLHLMRAEIITMLIYSDKYLLNMNAVGKHLQVFLPLDLHRQCG